MSPLEIEILLHYHYSTEDFRNLESPAISQAIKKFVAMGLIRETPDEGVCTFKTKYLGNKAALEVYVKALGEVPLPKNVWIIPDYNPRS